MKIKVLVKLSRVPADCRCFYVTPHLPADLYLWPIVSYEPRTEILRLRLRMTMKAGRSSRNADFVLIARQGDTITLGAAGAVKPKNLPAKGRSNLRTLTR